MSRTGFTAPIFITTLLLAFCPQWVSAQTDEPCFFLCAPSFKIEPTITFEPIFRSPTIETLENGVPIAREKQQLEQLFELVLAVGIPTQIPRLGFTLETIFVPGDLTEPDSVTGMMSAQSTQQPFRDNDIQFEFEVNLVWLESEQTRGWVESHFDIVDKFSRSERPGDSSNFTHKLNFELDTAVMVFNWLPEGNWLRNVEIEGSLDYVATGLPRAGDVIDGTEHFLEDASPWSFSLAFVFPLAPLAP